MYYPGIIYDFQWIGIVNTVYVQLQVLTVNFPLRDETVSIFSKPVLTFTMQTASPITRLVS
jgi:hypothetical protein